MKRLLLPLGIATLLLLGALAWKLAEQRDALEGPPRSSGVVEAVETDLASRTGGRLLRLHVQEGDRLEPGALVAELDCGPARAALVEAEARVAEARARADAQVAQARAAGESRRGASVSSQAARSRVAATETRRELAEREAARVGSLGAYASASSRDRAASEAEGLARELEAAEREAAGIASNARAAAAQADAARATADAAARLVASLEAVVERVRLDVAECEVRAARGGVVDDLFFEEGEVVPAGRAVARVVDLDRVEVTFYVPNEQVGRVQAGARAVVIADAFPDRSFEGVVSTVATEAAFTPRNVQTRSDRDRLVFPVEVKVPNPEHALRPGMPVDVTLREGATPSAVRERD